MNTTAGEITWLIADALRGITPAAGYQTDAGSRVYIEVEQLDSDAAVPAVSVFFNGEEDSAELAASDLRRMVGTWTVGGWVRPLTDDSGQQAHALLADIKRAVWSGLESQTDLAVATQERRYLQAEIEPRMPGADLQVLAVTGQIRWTETGAAAL